MSVYDYNQVILIGHVGNAPRIISRANSPSPASAVGLATNKAWRHNGEDYKTTHWHTLVFNNHLHEIAQARIQKGDRLFIQGELASYRITDKVTGHVRHETRVLVKTVRFFDQKTDGFAGADVVDSAEEQALEESHAGFAV